MPRRNLIRSKIHPYHVTARSNNKEAFYCGTEETWKIFNYYLNDVATELNAKIHAFVLMPNHFHLLISTPSEDLGIVMHKLMLFCTKAMNAKAGRIGHVFGGRYYWSIINTENYFDYVLKYIYRNPVKAGLAKDVLEYPYSTIRSHLSLQKLDYELSPIVGRSDLIPDNDAIAFLGWQNQAFQKEVEEAIRNGFKKVAFKPTRLGHQRKRVF